MKATAVDFNCHFRENSMCFEFYTSTKVTNLRSTKTVGLFFYFSVEGSYGVPTERFEIFVKPCRREGFFVILVLHRSNSFNLLQSLK